jgi:hypothetical protein
MERDESIAFRVHDRRQKVREKSKLRHSIRMSPDTPTMDVEMEAEVPEDVKYGDPEDEAEIQQVDDQLRWEYERFGTKPSVNAEKNDEPTIPSLGRKLSEAL